MIHLTCFTNNSYSPKFVVKTANRVDDLATHNRRTRMSEVWLHCAMHLTKDEWRQWTMDLFSTFSRENVWVYPPVSKHCTIYGWFSHWNFDLHGISHCHVWLPKGTTKNGKLMGHPWTKWRFIAKINYKWCISICFHHETWGVWLISFFSMKYVGSLSKQSNAYILEWMVVGNLLVPSGKQTELLWISPYF